MSVNKTVTQANVPGTPSSLGAQPHAGTAASAAPGTNAATKMSQSDLVSLSNNAVKQSSLSALMGGFQNSLVDTLSAYNPNSGMDSLYNLTGTPVDSYINKNLTNLTPDTKTSFMDMYSNLANTSGGLVPQNLMSQTFGQTGGASQFITALTNRLKQLPTSATASAGFPGAGGATGASKTR